MIEAQSICIPWNELLLEVIFTIYRSRTLFIDRYINDCTCYRDARKSDSFVHL